MKIATRNKKTSIFIFTPVYTGLKQWAYVTNVFLAFFNQKFGAQAEYGVFTLPAYKLLVSKNILSFAHDFTHSVARGLDLRHKTNHCQKKNNDYIVSLDRGNHKQKHVRYRSCRINQSINELDHKRPTSCPQATCGPPKLSK